MKKAKNLENCRKQILRSVQYFLSEMFVVAFYKTFMYGDSKGLQ